MSADKWKYIGKGIATCGVWIGSGIACYREPIIMLMVSFFAMLATTSIWEE